MEDFAQDRREFWLDTKGVSPRSCEYCTSLPFLMSWLSAVNVEATARRSNRITVKALSPNRVVQQICPSYTWAPVVADKSAVQNHSSLLRNRETRPRRKLDFWEANKKSFSPKTTYSTLSGLFCPGLWGPIGSCDSSFLHFSPYLR